VYYLPYKTNNLQQIHRITVEAAKK